MCEQIDRCLHHTGCDMTGSFDSVFNPQGHLRSLPSLSVNGLHNGKFDREGERESRRKRERELRSQGLVTDVYYPTTIEL